MLRSVEADVAANVDASVDWCESRSVLLGLGGGTHMNETIKK